MSANVYNPSKFLPNPNPKLLCAKDGEERRKGLIKSYMVTAIELHEIAYRLHCAMTDSEPVPYDALHDGSLQKVTELKPAHNKTKP